jgi:hypothetical protein
MPVDQILHGDCLNIMPTIPEASVDMVLPVAALAIGRIGR